MVRCLVFHLPGQKCVTQQWLQCPHSALTRVPAEKQVIGIKSKSICGCSSELPPLNHEKSFLLCKPFHHTNKWVLRNSSVSGWGCDLGCDSDLGCDNDLSYSHFPWKTP